MVSLNAAVPIMFFRHTGTNAPGGGGPTNEVGGFTTNMFIDAEDFNNDGVFFPSVDGNSFNATSLYLGESAIELTDFRANDILADGYRAITGVGNTEHDDDHEPNGVPYTDYKVRAFVNSDWCNYTRVFTNRAYRVYARASSTVGFGFQLDQVTSDPSLTEPQTTVTLGGFQTTGSGTNTFFYAPFTTNGVAVEFTLSDTNTLRVTCTNGIADFHRLMLVHWSGTPMGFVDDEVTPDEVFIDEDGIPFYDPEIL